MTEQDMSWLWKIFNEYLPDAVIGDLPGFEKAIIDRLEYAIGEERTNPVQVGSYEHGERNGWNMRGSDFWKRLKEGKQ